jgi:hypothetical protein
MYLPLNAQARNDAGQADCCPREISTTRTAVFADGGEKSVYSGRWYAPGISRHWMKYSINCRRKRTVREFNAM